MEELLRFVSIRAAERVEENNTATARLISLDTDSYFQSSLGNADPAQRTEVAKTFTESNNFIANVQNNTIGRELNRHYSTINSLVEENQPVSAILVALANALDISVPDKPEADKRIRKALQALTGECDWRSLKKDLPDSLIAVSYYQPEGLALTNNHQNLLRLVHLTEQAAQDTFTSEQAAGTLSAMLSSGINLGAKPARPDSGDDPEPKPDDGNKDVALNARRLNKAAEFLVTVPKSELEANLVELESKIFPERGEANKIEQGTVEAGLQLNFSIKASALEKVDDDIREILTDTLKSQPNQDISTASLALRHQERNIYENAVLINTMQVGGTKLSPAVNSAFKFADIVKAGNIILHPGFSIQDNLFLPGILPGLFGPRFGSLGVGELLVIKQNLKAYQALDVAHIENILQGETKERTHRRKRLTEESVFTESEQETEEERDTQTSERFELRSEVQEEVKEQFKIEAGLKVTAQLGPFVELEADTKFSYENAKTEGRKKASSYSKETTERASSRFAQRMLERRERRLVEEVEETNAHGFNAVDAEQNISGVYQWVNKIYQAQVYNYGIRQMYEFFLPEPATYYISSLVSKAMSDGETPTPPPPFTLSSNTLNRSNYKYYAALFGATGVPAPPEEFVKVDLAQAGGPLDFDSSENGQVAAAFSVQIPEGYEYHGYSAQWRYSYRGDYDFRVSVSENFGDPGTVPVWVKGRRIVSWTVWVHIGCRLTASALDAWRIKAWEALQEGHAQMQREFEERVAAAAVQDGVEISGRNPGANARIIRDELQRQCITAFTNKSPAGNAGISGTPGSLTINWSKAYEKGLYARFMHHAFEWENMSFVFYPYFWARASRWLELFNIEDIDPDFQSFLQSGMVRIVVPVRPGFEAHVEYFRRNGKIWSGEQPPTVGDPDFLSIAAEIQANTGAPGDEEPVGDPWDIRVPTALVKLRQDNELPKWRQDEDGNWVEDDS